MAERIKVSGYSVPRSGDGSRHKRNGVPLVQPRNLVWLGILASMPIIAAIWGTPHLLSDYTYVGPSVSRFYVDCRYLGLNGRLIHPRDGRCPLVRFLKASGE